MLTIPLVFHDNDYSKYLTIMNKYEVLSLTLVLIKDTKLNKISEFE